MTARYQDDDVLQVRPAAGNTDLERREREMAR